MDTRQLGRTGVEVSRAILGCGNFGGIGSAPAFFGAGESREEAFALMDAAWELGITTFDTADAYGGGRSETWIGEWIRATGTRPTLTTKTYNPMEDGGDHGLAPARIERQIERSLERLGVDRVDIYLAHASDAQTPVADTLATFERLVEGGLIQVYGVSNFAADELRAALDAGAPAVVQNSYSLLDRQDDDGVLPLCEEHHIAYEAFSPLAGGWLAGRYRRGERPPPGSRMAARPEPYRHLQSEQTFAALDVLQLEASKRGVSTAALSLAWLLSRSAVTAVVVGPRRPEHLQPVREALELELTPDEVDSIGGLFSSS